MALSHVTRFAPSPTGHLHIGGARTALFCWAFAKRNGGGGGGGKFLLRIEDTDAARSSDESARGIMEDLAWLGIDWDEGPTLTYTDSGTTRTIGGDPRGVGPFFQAQRLAKYNAAIMRLVEQGKAYPAFETSEELEAARKVAVAAKQTYRYDRASYNKIPDIAERIRRMQSGEPHVVRFFAPAEAIVVRDDVLGDVKIAAGELDDFVIRKQDGLPTYHFAVVCDDEAMGVTHVLRAQEHLANTPRHVALQKALGFRTPAYAHMPLIFNVDGTKMSKRDKAKTARKALKDAMAKNGPDYIAGVCAGTKLDEKTLKDFLAAENDSIDTAQKIAAYLKITLPEIEVADFRSSGYLPEAILCYVALLGWNPGLKLPDGKDREKFTLREIGELFSLDRIGKTNSKFDRAKLLSFNADYLAQMTDEQFAQRWWNWCNEELAANDPAHAPANADIAALVRTFRSGDTFAPSLVVLARAVKPRAKTFRDAIKSSRFALLTDADVAAQFAADPAPREKNLLANNQQGLTLLREFLPILEQHTPWTGETLHAALEQFAKSKSLANPGPIAQALRVALTGTGVTPGMTETLELIGRDRTLHRVKVLVVWLTLQQLVIAVVDKQKLLTTLFATEDAVTILQNVARSAFARIQDAMFDDVMLSVARLLDPAKQGKYSNLTIEAAIVLVSDHRLRDVLMNELDAARHASKSILEIRNKRLGHEDLGVPDSIDVKEISQAVERIVKLVERLETVFWRGSQGLGPITYKGSGATLLEVLNRAASIVLVPARSGKTVYNGSQALPDDDDSLPELSLRLPLT